MLPVAVALVVFLFVLAGTLLGRKVRKMLPDHHLSPESKEVVMLGTGMIATMTALILGLMTASAKSSFDAVDTAVKHIATDSIALDRALAGYGPETKEVRDLVRARLELAVAANWPEDGGEAVPIDTRADTSTLEAMQKVVVNLSPKDDTQRFFQSQALTLMTDLLQTRVTVFATAGTSIPALLLVVVVLWLALIFGSFGLFAPDNATVLAVLVVCALSVAASVFLILEMDQPFGGLMKTSSAPLHYALQHIGQ